MPRSSKSKTKTKATPTQKTLVTMLLDRSGSMGSIKAQTLAAINSYLGELRTAASDIRFSLVQFDTDHQDGMALEKTFVGAAVKDVRDLTDADFHPRGMTPLLDAIQTTIGAVQTSLLGRDDIKCVFVIQTDGMENASREATWASVQALIDAKTKAGWEFLFMGAGLKEQTYSMADRLGVTRDKTLSYGTDMAETQAAFAATAANIRGYSEGTLASAAYSSHQKLRAGDVVDGGVSLDPTLFPVPSLPATPAPQAPHPSGGSRINSPIGLYPYPPVGIPRQPDPFALPFQPYVDDKTPKKKPANTANPSHPFELSLDLDPK
jgi:hypothetical protein